jgi:hypothetical protein
MRFGESFPQGADSTNRMDVIKIKEGRQDVPDYIKFGLEIRSALQTKVEAEGWPDLPDPEQINLTEDIFEAAKNQVNLTWDESVKVLIEEKAEEWGRGLDANDSETKEAKELLNNPAEMSKSFSLRQFGVLESLRTVNPEAWRALVVASSERQLASIAVMEHWLKYGNPESLQAITEKIGLSQEELKLFVETAAILGKYVDHAYVKQIELADKPGGSEATKLGEEDGAQYLYDFYKAPGSEDIDIKTYSQVFPYEWEKIQSRLGSLANRSFSASQAGQLPASYQKFGTYLEKTSQVYGSKSTEPEVLDKEWDDLYKMAKELDDSDCPITLIPQGCTAVAGEAGKIDAEIRLGLKTKESKEQENSFNEFTKTAQEILDNNRSSLAKDYQIPSVSLNYQPWAFGPNLYWMTRGESNESQILSHTNAVTEVAIVKEIPLLRKAFASEPIDEDSYSRAAVAETVLHETGHNVLDSEDKSISKRIGKSFEAGILEELKAETVGMKILSETIKKGNLPSGIDIRSQLQAKLGGNLDYLKNKSSQKAGAGEPYYICGVAIIGGLLEKGLISQTKAGYEIREPEACLQQIAALGDKVLSFYTNPDSKPADVKNYIKELRGRGQDQTLRDLIKSL